MYHRILDLGALATQKSFFLFGPRSTGKTTLLNQQFSPDALINLLRSSTYLPLSERPSSLEEAARAIAAKHPVVVIDEIQKLPSLLDEVHHLIEAEGMRFVMTGSSARKLRRGGVNLLAGRAWQAELFPLVSAEIDDFDLLRYLRYGGLPQVYASPDPLEELDAYINTYLKEEIKEEALVQRFAHFARFLSVAALSCAEQLNFASVASDAGVPVSSVRAWFGILQDSFLGFFLEPWRASKKRKAVAAAKFYFFDVGVANFLRGSTQVAEGGEDFGKAFETFMAMELRAWLSYRRKKLELCYWRTQSGAEVDFLLGTELAIEVKATRTASDKHLKGLRALGEEGVFRQRILVSLDELERLSPDGIRIMHWRPFLNELWAEGFGL